MLVVSISREALFLLPGLASAWSAAVAAALAAGIVGFGFRLGSDVALAAAAVVALTTETAAAVELERFWTSLTAAVVVVVRGRLLFGGCDEDEDTKCW